MKTVYSCLLMCWFVILGNATSSAQTITPTGTYTCTGTGTAELTLPTGYAVYQWFNASNVQVASTQKYVAAVGTYTAKVRQTASSTIISVPAYVVSGIVPTAPTITPPADVSSAICGAASRSMSASTASNYSWSINGASLALTTQSISILGSSVGTPGTYNYTVATTNTTSGCSATSTAVALIVSPKPATPTISPVSPNLVCGSDTKTLTATSGSSSYAWKRNGSALSATTNMLTISGNDVSTANTYSYTVSTQNSVGCISDDSSPLSMRVSPKPATPTITPVSPNLVCGTETKTLVTSGGDAYLWKRSGTQLASTINTLVVTGNDVTTPNSYNYTVAVQNSVGCYSDDSPAFVMKVSPKPTTPSIGTVSPNLICGTDTKTITATSGGDSYNWKRNAVSINNTIVNTLVVKGTDVSTGGSFNYSVALTNSVGCISDDSAPIVLQLFPTIPTKPTITANGNTTFCQGFTVLIKSSYTANLNVWSRAVSGDTTTTGSDGITVRNTNTYTVKAKDANGCFSVSSDAFVVTVNPLPAPPVIAEGTAVRVCDLDSISISSNDKGTGSYLWSNNKTTRTIFIKSAGNYSLTFTDANTCISKPSLVTVLTVDPLPAKPIITALRPTEFCNGNFTSLKSSASAGYLWSTGETAEGIDVIVSSSITVRAISDKGCKSKDLSDITKVVVNPLPATPTISANRMIPANDAIRFCPDSTVVLTSSASPTDYIWTDLKGVAFSTTQSVELNKTGQYTVQTVSDKKCASKSSAIIKIEVREAPQAASILATPSPVFCEGGKVSLKALVANGNVAKYSWRDEDTQKEVSNEQETSAVASGRFSVKVRDTFGCFSEYSKIITVKVNPLPNKPTIRVIAAKVFCAEDSTVLEASLPTTTPNGTKNVYRWMVDGKTVNGATARVFAWKAANTIAVAVTDTNGCKSLVESDTIKTTVNPLPNAPTITIKGANPFCADKSVTLNAAGSTETKFKWSNAATTSTITINTAGNVTVQAINGFGCLSKPSSVVTLRVLALPLATTISASGNTTLCDGDKVRLTSASNNRAYWWRSSTDSLGIGEDFTSIFITKSGNYYARVQDANNCFSVPSQPIAVDVKASPVPPVIKKIGTFTLDAQSVGDENGYFWKLDGQIQTDLTTKAIKAKKNGVYQVQASINYTGVPLSGGKLVCYSLPSESLKYEQDLTFEGMSIFPNPSPTGQVTIEVIEDLIGANLLIYTLTGQLVTEYTVDKFNTLKKLNLPAYYGTVFLVKIKTDGFEKVKKVVVLN